MPDFLAGQRLTALHFPPTVEDTQNDSFTFDATTFGVDADSGTYNDCGVAFVAPITGRVQLFYAARMGNNTDGNSTHLTPVVREGAVVGSGSTVLAASVNNMIDIQAANNSGNGRCGSSMLLDSLTPGDSYNVRLEHAVTAGTGTILSRTVVVRPAT